MLEEGVRGRILAAAKAEFADFGLAGARVDRIAKMAGTSKERLYANFSDKVALYAEVRRLHSLRFEEIIGPDMNDIVGTVTRLFDYFNGNSVDARLNSWIRLEAKSVPAVAEGGTRVQILQERIEQVRAAQAAGRIRADWQPIDVLNLFYVIGSAWAFASPGIKAADPDGTLEQRREAAIRAATLLFLGGPAEA